MNRRFKVLVEVDGLVGASNPLATLSVSHITRMAIPRLELEGHCSNLSKK